MNRKWWLLALVFCLVLATVSPLASSSPDGLERVAEDEGFSSLARESPFSLAADYLFPGIENETLAIMLAGWLGTVVLFGAAYGLARLIISRKKQAEL
ncbi:MAG: PDGLE domain-containing protein [Dehalococcoidales bacterium]|nr:PDGLE domain-containing protein [Dehalococcoidales bacterium]